MKKGLYWFSKLKREDQIRFCKNYTNCGTNKKSSDTISEYLLKDFNSIRDFMGSSFIWVDTKEGPYYWSDIMYKTQ